MQISSSLPLSSSPSCSFNLLLWLWIKQISDKYTAGRLICYFFKYINMKIPSDWSLTEAKASVSLHKLVGIRRRVSGKARTAGTRLGSPASNCFPGYRRTLAPPRRTPAEASPRGSSRRGTASSVSASCWIPPGSRHVGDYNGATMLIASGTRQNSRECFCQRISEQKGKITREKNKKDNLTKFLPKKWKLSTILPFDSVQTQVDGDQVAAGAGGGLCDVDACQAVVCQVDLLDGGQEEQPRFEGPGERVLAELDHLELSQPVERVLLESAGQGIALEGELEEVRRQLRDRPGELVEAEIEPPKVG